MSGEFTRGGMSVMRRSSGLVGFFALGGLAIGCGLVLLPPSRIGADAAQSTEGTHAGNPAVNVGAAAGPALTDTAAAFPLVAQPGKRYLLDSAGTPFLIRGDTGWSLITQLTREEVDLYLEDRRGRGFNTILAHLIQASFGTDAPANAYGELPFLIPADFTTPNESYFAHADWVLRRAAEMGFLVLLTPSYVGAEGDSEGWYRAMIANGPDQLRWYGKYLGRRYRDYDNILWVHGGDYNLPERQLVRAVALGIREEGSRALHTAHGSRQTSALNHWEGEAWLQVNNIYASLPDHWSSAPVYAAALEQYARPERLPFFLLDGVYENEHEATERHLRTQAYQAVLSGAAGQIFGNNPVWHFNGWVGPYSFFAMDDWFTRPSLNWQQALASRGAQSMTHLYNLLMGIRWWQLEPDADKRFLIGGLGPEDARAVAARASDGSFAIIYLPSNRPITVDLGQLAGPDVAVRWYDPADGGFFPTRGSPFLATGYRQFMPDRERNSSGFDDWVLILESLPARFAEDVSGERAQPLRPQ
jgi:hypothetical protein